MIRSQARALAKRIVRQRDLAQLRARFGRIFSTFDPQDVIENQQDTVTKGLWTGGIGNLNNMDIYVNYKILFNLKIIILFIKKLFLAKKKLSYNLIKEME